MQNRGSLQPGTTAARGWIHIERRAPLPEFHPYRKFNTTTSWFSRRFRLANFRTLFDDVLAAGIPEQTTG